MERQILVRSGSDLTTAVGEIRRARQLTQNDLAEDGGISRSYLSQIEAGRSVSLLEHTLRLLRRLGAEVTISFDTEQPPSTNRRSLPEKR